MFSTKITLGFNTLNSDFYGIANGNLDMHLYNYPEYFEKRHIHESENYKAHSNDLHI